MYFKSLDQFESDVMQIFNCNTDWPICLFDFTFKNRIPNFITLKIENYPPRIIDDYFALGAHHHGPPLNILKEDEFTFACENTDNLLMEKNRHYCCIHKAFIGNFKALYEKCDKRLFENLNLNFNICNDIESEENLMRFLEEISSFNYTFCES